MAKQVVIGEDATGRTNTRISEIELKPLGGGFRYSQLWGSDEIPSFPNDGTPPVYGPLYPGPNGYRFMLMSLLPAQSLSPDDSGPVEIDEGMQKLLEDAGISSAAAGDAPGMHRTDTVDLGMVVSGTLILELDSGEMIELHAGDSFIQNGANHNWHNPGSTPATLIVALIGGHPRD
ncbi:cupin domain-containing protein [Sphingosinicella microcystinivorans]|uniref:cupin domain-containing protein n=1 Tax=Sphingosinicella microcystinivorans TaxID=335406 RepID=UPI0022F3E18E|nr:cupin domain-containing protein [Sphingosinicella microcystinivorans]WBX83764.1 cupin domain-containing protein [Sphingosinicella microcystinivorans]